MKYNFDKIVCKQNRESVKWSFDDEILPMGIADMDFETLPEIKEAIIERLSRDIYGYSNLQVDYKPTLIEWYEKLHDWKIEEEWLCISPGVSPAIGITIRALANSGDKVILQTPVYPPFFGEITHNGCSIVNNPLLLDESGYHMDYEDLEKKASDVRVKLLLLCNPHNPVGRVWTRDELTKLGEICLRHNVIVIADEIHGDLVFKGNRYIPFASISEDFAKNSITCTAPSKTFNLAGFQVSNIIIPNCKLRAEYEIGRHNIGISRLNVFASGVCTAAYRHGQPWLEELMTYLEDNKNYVLNYIKKYLPQISVIEPEGTYMLWMDFRSLGLRDEQLHNLIFDQAKIVLNEGHTFGQGGDGFQRMNIACPRSIIQEALERLRNAIEKI
ncbi:MAG: cystathione beta-lyase [Fusobacteria bacterium]|nr:MAG: cystathione beta-lyase [Fusobacteriota bacterium]KAF0229145.1 MAG: cystathione [Fusobacteriota bacterium]